MASIIQCPETCELYRTINAIAAGRAEYPGNKIDPVVFVVDESERHVANSMYAAVEWLSAARIDRDRVRFVKA